MGYRVAVLESQRLLREALCERLAREGLEVVAACASAAELLERLARAGADAAVIGLGGGVQDAHALGPLGEVRERAPHVPAVALASALRTHGPLGAEAPPASAALAERCLALGACAFVDAERQGLDDVLRAVAAAARGERMVPVSALSDVWAQEGLPQASPPSALQRLTPREADVLRHLSGGADNGRIAQCLGISERTVRAHVSSLYGKLGCSSRAQMAVFARGLGVRPPGGPVA